ncbi:MAG: B-box zinc finger protein [Terracidiphilus sp.]
MDCVNHSGRVAVYYCQNCGKPLCVECTVSGALGHGSSGNVLCKDCAEAWRRQRYQSPVQPPFVAPYVTPPSGPNPAAAAVLGVIPGVGAMYNGQFFKGFIHVVVFAVLISITDHYPIFGLFIAAWILYQSFEAYHTARALRDGQPVPDPFGLNEVGNWLNLGSHQRTPGQPGAEQAPAGPAPAGYQPPVAGESQPPSQAPSQGQYQAPIPPMPPPMGWGNRVPVGAIVLIALGMLFLLGQLDVFHGRFMEFAWPLMLIALGVWLIVRRFEESQGGPK